MIPIKSTSQIKRMREACRISAQALEVAGKSISDGMSTKELDNIINKFIVSCGAKPSFLGYGGFKGSACISINDEVIHGIPSRRKIIKSGDIVSVDVGAYYDGFHGDNAYTFAVGEISAQASKLLEVTQECLYKGIEQAKPGARIGDISSAVERHATAHSLGVVKKFVGHGVGADLHEPPDVPNYGVAGRGPRLVEGMTIAIEPMINLVGEDIVIMPDKWTVKTASGSLSAHFEHTIAITSDGAVVLTKP